MSRAHGDLLAFLVPSVDERHQPTGERVARRTENLAHAALAPGVKAAALRIVADVERRPLLQQVERRPVAFQFAHVAADALDFLPVLVVEVVPRTGGLDIGYALCLHAQGEQRKQQTEKESFHKLGCLRNRLQNYE